MPVTDSAQEVRRFLKAHEKAAAGLSLQQQSA
jgi:hypothetical protein